MSKSTAPTRGSQPAAVLAIVALAASALATAWWSSEALLVERTVSESRTVADLAENVGKWASQYGGVHVRTLGTDARIPGNFLTRSVYAATGGDAGVLAGARSALPSGEGDAMKRVESYFWKNPALIQREVADVITSSGSRARYRLTARTVMNPNNAPNAFELEALDALRDSPMPKAEYWRVRDGELRYARTVVAQKSCLNCHTSAQAAPEFIRTNGSFNGGGGFGYQEGRPIGVISVTVPLPATSQVLAGNLPPQAWAALAAAVLAAGWLGALALRRR
jgi:hypothetical protein